MVHARDICDISLDDEKDSRIGRGHDGYLIEYVVDVIDDQQTLLWMAAC